MTSILRQLEAHLGLTSAALYLHREEQGTLDLAGEPGSHPEDIRWLESVPSGGGALAGLAEATSEIQIADGPSALPLDVTNDAKLDARAGGCSALALPLVFGGRLLGVVMGIGPPSGPVSPAAREKLTLLARLVAVALAQVISRRSREMASTRLRQSYHASQTMVSALSILPEHQLHAAVRRGFYIWPQYREASVPEFIAAFIQEVVDEARAVAGAGIAAIGIGDIPDRPFEPWATSGIPESVVAAVGRTPRPVGTLGIVACEGKIVRVANVRDHPSFRGLPEHHPPVSSLLAVPIRYRGRSLGNLYLANKVGAEEFSEHDQDAVEAIANQTAVALQMAFLQASVEAQRAQTQSLLDSAPHGILFIDAQTRRVMANPSAMRLLGFAISPNAEIERYVERLRTWDGQPVLPEAALAFRALRGEEPPAEQLILVRGDGTEIPITESAAPVRGFGNKLLGAVINFEDVSAIRDLERMRNIDRVHEEFNAMVAHDLRNPIQTVLAQIYLLIGKVHGDEVEVTVPVKALRRIERSATTLGQMARVLLDAARVQLKRVDLDRQPVHLPDVVAELIERLQPAPTLDHRRIELSVEGLVPMVDLDQLAFEQILGNLVENAAKFSSPAAPIRVFIRPADGGATVSVHDDGSGIAPEDQAHLFDRFYQVRGAREKKTGLGLGLFIVKGYVEAHGGQVRVESELGRGSTFHVWFPAATTPPPQVSAPP